MTIASPSSLSTALNDDTLVRTLGTSVSGPAQIPEGTNGTVMAVFGSGATCEVLFGPPVSADEIVAESLLAVA